METIKFERRKGEIWKIAEQKVESPKLWEEYATWLKRKADKKDGQVSKLSVQA